MSAIFLFPFLRVEWWYDRYEAAKDAAKRAAKRQRRQQGGDGGGERTRMSTPRERMRALWRLVSAPFTASAVDARTGDTLTAGEKWSWRAQLVMRRWPFLLAINIAVAVVWTVVDPIWRHSPADTVNYLLSLLAIDIEGLTAMALIMQTLRDAVINRAVRRMADQNLRMETAHGEQLTRLSAQVVALTALVQGQQQQEANGAVTGQQSSPAPATANAVYEGRGKPRAIRDPDAPTLARTTTRKRSAGSKA